MKAFLAVIFALLTTAVFAAPAGYDRPGGYHEQANGGSLSSSVGACAPTSPTVWDTNGTKPGGEYTFECGKEPVPVLQE